MAEKRLVVDARIPPPGRTLVNLVQQLLKSPKSKALRTIRDGNATVNGQLFFSPLHQLEAGDLLIVREAVVKTPAPRKERFSREVNIVFQDRHLAVVEKPPGLLTVPTPQRESHTLLSLLQKQWRRSQPDAVACCVHRLDRSVSGLLVFAKSVEIADCLRNQFEQRKPERVYVAITQGVIREPAGTFRSYLATDSKTLHRYSTRNENQGELAISHYQVLHQHDGLSVVEVRLETGRRNQIRVHFADAGHALLGDTRYGPQPPPTKSWPHRRLALHARSLGFKHPVTEQALHFTSKLPREFWPFVPRD